MRRFKNKQCLICDNEYTPLGSNSKYCSEQCSETALKLKQPLYSATYRKKQGRQVGIGSGGLTKNGKDNFNYKNGIGIFHKIKHLIRKEIRYCERCNKDLKDVSKYHWCVHHKDHNRSNNERSNFELLCKRCHLIEHECWKAFEGVETKVERDPLTGRYKRIEAPSPANVGDDIVRSI